MIRGHGIIGPLFGSQSPIHIPDLAAHLERNSLEEANDQLAVSSSVRTALFVPMLRNDELIGSVAVARLRELQMQLAHTNRVVTLGELSHHT